ncbi:isochorismatase family protein [Methylocystis hirsuta]|uniref:Isochorismatase family protein n=1 Tax=Methylocystis hirsuta TaxID=369798 RepID=A0A3M9XJG6_9HYPH|nr:isochorismatase family protein [Methylocystis hirsuta]
MNRQQGRGARRDQYSAFDGTSLTNHLRRRGIHRALIVGLGQNFCVRTAALDAIAAGFETHVRLSTTRSITLRGGQDAVDALRGAGVIVEEN